MTGPKKFLFVLNDGPYGNERSFNGLRMALNLLKQPDTLIQVFLIGDGVVCGLAGQTTPNGQYNIGRMLAAIARRGKVAT